MMFNLEEYIETLDMVEVFEPAGHRVLIKPKTVEEKSDGGIILHNNDIQKKLERAGNDIGTVYSVGMNAWKAYDGGEPWAVVGDKVIYAKYGGVFVTNPLDGEEYVLINDADVSCVLKRQVVETKDDELIERIKDGGDIAKEIRAENKYALEHFNRLNEQQEEQSYFFTFLTPMDFDNFFGILRGGDFSGYKSQLDTELEDA